MKILVAGSLHGAWDKLVEIIQEIECKGTKIDLIIVPGDSHTLRTESDFESFVCPRKYRLMGSLKIDIPTIVLGGNSDTMDWFYQMPFGGWLAPNIFYVGRASSFIFGDIKLAFISGLFSSDSYYCTVKEKFPIRSKDQLRTSYYIRSSTDFQVYGLSSCDIIATHDWPTGSAQYSEEVQQKYTQLVEADKNGKIGLPKGIEIMKEVKPKYWFASHNNFYLNAQIGECSFTALAEPPASGWYEIIDVEGNPGTLQYSGEWISILKATTAEMETPRLLSQENWHDKWQQMKPSLIKIPDQPFEAVELDPVKYTISFCRKYGIYCPNKEIRPLI